MHWYLTLLAIGLFSFASELHSRGRRAKRDLPANGFSGIWSSYLYSVLNCFHAKSAIQDACLRFKGRLFTFSLLGQWVVLARERGHVRDLCNAPEDVLSMELAAEELLQLRHIVGPLFTDELYHIPAIRTKLNLNLGDILPHLLEEMYAAFEDIVDTQIGDKGWSSITVYPTVCRVVCRVTSRVFVGKTLCRNEEYCKLASRFTDDVLVAGPILKFLIPSSLRSSIGKLYKMTFGHHKRMQAFLGPLIEDRQQKLRQNSKFTLPNDMLTWLMETAPSTTDQHYTESISMRMLNVNFVAMHTTTKTFTHALYYLASQRQYLPVLRDEVEQHLDSSDFTTWTKEALAHCVKLDSFFKETLRLNGLGATWMPRLTVSDFKFSDGTHIPKGYFVATAASVIHEDNTIYNTAQEFDGLRFSVMRKIVAETEEWDWRHKMTSTSEAYVAFGGGRHICPGRFFCLHGNEVFTSVYHPAL
ncbi:cytochrome P450 [Rhodocollybia butyracea]|uniref:Cytochrome P450 n=1 Tax=Rhodocollybia butyracea TaxID=206335 RepID=A0A9P5P955_9AGAR|nr:cytochrome P450 [Rhodocollybia butyracea]